MIAPLLFTVIAVPFLIALWVVAWLIGDLFAGREAEAIPVPSDGIR